MKKWGIVSLGAIVIVAGIALVTLLKPNEASRRMSSASTSPSPRATPSSDAPSELAMGMYTDYNETAITDTRYDKTILFFHAPWCVECRGFEAAIESSEIPKGVQILKVDYDSSTELRKRYGVTIQSTFVRVNGAGEKESVWVGYGKDKSAEAIIKNTQ